MPIDLYFLPVNQSASERDDKCSGESCKLKKKKKSRALGFALHLSSLKPAIASRVHCSVSISFISPKGGLILEMGKISGLWAGLRSYFRLAIVKFYLSAGNISTQKFM